MKLSKEKFIISTIIRNRIIKKFIFELLDENKKNIKYSKNEYLGFYNAENKKIFVPKISYLLIDEKTVLTGIPISYCFQVMILIHEIIHSYIDRCHISANLDPKNFETVIKSEENLMFDSLIVHKNIFINQSIRLNDYILGKIEYMKHENELLPVIFELYILLNYYRINKENSPFYDLLEKSILNLIIVKKGENYK